MTRPRVVLISMYVGHEGVPHAGGRYLLELQRLLERETELTMLTVGNRLNHESANKPGVPGRLLLLGHEQGLGLAGKVQNRLAMTVEGAWRHRRDPGMPFVPFIVGLLRSREARAAVREADVIDLQYSESIRLVRLLRRLNPTARITGTFHDVMSQSFSREPQDSPEEERYWQGVARRSRGHEKAMVARLDEVLVFSDKDAELLGNPPHTVVHPPLSDGTEPRHPPATEPVVVVVSYLARDENNKAALWAIEHVWPAVVAQHPGARLRFVGGGASEELRDRVGCLPASSGVELAGFVDDLGAEYEAAAVALVPVLQGAGVKFKTVEALCHGVPVVTTTVGAEGIDGDDLYAGLADDPTGVADALVAVLTDTQAAQERSDRVQGWAQETYGRARFEETIRSTWA
ncbi:glycosyltransferase involved in cell wall biosynthesis [Nocardioides cavernae]|uniref:Glycosyltransferase involved in cell wall biosynthesis n=1 Tax=Nocardioides cavernae TaxID=1921566 RepID=A0A7Y9H0L6_9ACTN|nr:glycosyltransferase [Nocardioides cavernae]NYE35779.1 glycosyltransferase involved in cell wall biosynthesis [Nocardioides cavernae]